MTSWFRHGAVAVAVAAAGLAVACAVHAHDGAHAATRERSTASAAPPKHWDFTLPTLDGTRFVRVSTLPGPLLVNFWGRDCAPCVAELPRLQAFAHDNPSWTVILVATDPPAEAAAFLQQRGIGLTTLRPGANVAGLMRAAGNRQGALPFSVSLHEGEVCGTELGEVSEARLAILVAECGASSGHSNR